MMYDEKKAKEIEYEVSNFLKEKGYDKLVGPTLTVGIFRALLKVILGIFLKSQETKDEVTYGIGIEDDGGEITGMIFGPTPDLQEVLYYTPDLSETPPKSRTFIYMFYPMGSEPIYRWNRKTSKWVELRGGHP